MNPNEETINRQSALTAAYNLGRQAAVERIHNDDEDGLLPFMLAIGGDGALNCIALDHLLVKPNNRRAELAVLDIDSLAKYIADFNDGRTKVFCNESQFKAIINYHDNDPQNCDHRVTMSLEQSPQFMKWLNPQLATQGMDQVSFVEFLDLSQADIVQPTAASIIELLKDLHGSTNAEFHNSFDLESGAAKINFNKTVNVRGGNPKTEVESLAIPRKLTIKIPVYLYDSPTTVEFNLRFRVRAGNLTFLLSPIVDADTLLRTAFLRQVATLQEREELQGVSVVLGHAPNMSTIRKIT